MGVELTEIHVEIDSSSTWVHTTAGMRCGLIRRQQDRWLSKDVTGGLALSPTGEKVDSDRISKNGIMTLQWQREKKKILAFSSCWKERMCVALAAERQPSCDHKGNQCEDKPRKTNKPSSYLFHTVFDDKALKISLSVEFPVWKKINFILA